MKWGWLSNLTTVEKRTFAAAFGGLALDSMDTTIYALVTPTLIAVLGITRPEAGMLATGNLVGAAIGGWIGGVLADRYGRVRILQWTIMLVAASSLAAAFADGFAYLLTARIVQGLGYGAESAVGAVLVMEVVRANLRVKVASAIQSGYAVGNAISVGILPVLFYFLPANEAWRWFLAIGFLPAVIVIFVRRFVPESQAFVGQVANKKKNGVAPFWIIFTGVHLGRTVTSTLLTVGTLGAAYVMITWLPTYMATVLHLDTTHTSLYLALNIFGSFCGPFVSGHLAGRFGRKRNFSILLVLQATVVICYTQLLTVGAATFALGFFLGAFQAALASSLLPAFSELFPTEIRANGSGFALSVGRGIGAVVPAMVGILSVHFPLGDAMMVCAIAAYALAFVTSLILPTSNDSNDVVVDPSCLKSAALHGRVSNDR